MNDYEEDGPVKEAKLTTLFAKAGLIVYFVNNNTEAEQLRSALQKKV